MDLEADILLATKCQFPEFQFLIDLQQLLQLQLHLHSVSLKVKQYLQPLLMLKGRAKQKNPMLDLSTFTLLTPSQLKQFNLHVKREIDSLIVH